MRVFRTSIIRAGLLFLLAYVIAGNSSASPTPGKIAPDKGLLLVATKNLDNTPFQKTIILLTHYNNWEAMGFAINRPSQTALQEIMIEQDKENKFADPLYAGGPVRPNTLFVIINTDAPEAGMRHVIDTLFVCAIDIARKQATPKNTRVYNGYAGWTREQLLDEIEEGDWLVIPEDPKLIFDKDNETLWERLYQKWSGSWT